MKHRILIYSMNFTHFHRYFSSFSDKSKIHYLQFEFIIYKYYNWFSYCKIYTKKKNLNEICNGNANSFTATAHVLDLYGSQLKC